jgi:hypothetical protein
MEILGELTALVGSLSVPGNVYTRSGAVPVGLTEEVYALALEAQEEWAEEAVKGAVGPASPARTVSLLCRGHRGTAGRSRRLSAPISASSRVVPSCLNGSPSATGEGGRG